MQDTLDSDDIGILKIIQENSHLTAREISSRLELPITTVFAKIKRMERMKIIKAYHAILDSSKLNFGTTAFILLSFAYKGKAERALSQRDVAREISKFPEVQEVHIITGDWDMILKMRAKDVESVGQFVIDKLRLVTGIDKTLTCLVFASEKESAAIPL
jgi:DNA-binding Lrp family transcriptional regulator